MSGRCRTRSASTRAPVDSPVSAGCSPTPGSPKSAPPRQKLSARVLSIFDDVDVVITPGAATGPSRIGAYRKRGAVSTLALVAARVPFQAVFNATGQPAAVVPWGLDRKGLPLSIQLVGRPFDEATLLSLAAEIEADRPWAQRRPSVS